MRPWHGGVARHLFPSSSDSREWGLVPKRYIIGKVQVRWWPLPKARMFE